MSYPVLTATSDKRVSWVRMGRVILGMVEWGGGGGGGGGVVLGRTVIAVLLPSPVLVVYLLSSSWGLQILLLSPVESYCMTSAGQSM